MFTERLLHRLVVLLLCIGDSQLLPAQEIVGITDGPYVFYEGAQVKVKSIYNNRLMVDSFPVADKQRRKVNVRSAENPSWNFDVSFQPSLDTLPSVTSQQGPLFILSDVEGEFEVLRRLLLNNKIIDKKYNWLFGNGSLVIAGDVFDRGQDVTACLWLLYKLEQDARAKGGAVHFVLGNHEIMNLAGDFRYVQPKYGESARLLQTAYDSLYTSRTELGRWLRSKNIMERVGEVVVVHGGVSPAMLAQKRSIEAVNALARPWYDQALAENLPAEIDALFNDSSPFWYRGYFIEPRATQSQVDSILSFYGGRRIVVGHTVVKEIFSLYGSKVIAIDVDVHKGKSEALLVTDNRYYRVNGKGKKKDL
jgi:hypothetical protein